MYSYLCLLWIDGKVSAYNVGDLGSIPGSGRFSGEGNGNPLQYSCLENPMDQEAWWATVHGVAKSQTRPTNFTLLHHEITKPLFAYLSAWNAVGIQKLLDILILAGTYWVLTYSARNCAKSVWHTVNIPIYMRGIWRSIMHFYSRRSKW